MLRDPTPGWTYAHAAPLRRIRGQTFGIVGLGRIGIATALRESARLPCGVLRSLSARRRG
ncbi:MAG: hypothetical protein QM811_28750 [Pirellulales bacterium]